MRLCIGENYYWRFATGDFLSESSFLRLVNPCARILLSFATIVLLTIFAKLSSSWLVQPRSAELRFALILLNTLTNHHHQPT